MTAFFGVTMCRAVRQMAEMQRVMRLANLFWAPGYGHRVSQGVLRPTGKMADFSKVWLIHEGKVIPCFGA